MEKRNGSKEWSSNDASLQNIVTIEYNISSGNGVNTKGGGNSILEIYGKNKDGSGSEILLLSKQAKTSGKSHKVVKDTYNIPTDKVVTRIYAKVSSTEQENRAVSSISAVYEPKKSWTNI